MALGALGLGGVAALPASAQQIPAPDLFDGQVACSMNVPKLPESLVGEGKGITAKIATKMTIDVGTEDAEDFGTPQGDDEHLEDILYVIPAENKNCGSAMYTQAEFDAATAGSMEAGFEVGDQKPIANDVGKDVGEGYSETLTKFMEKMKADNAEKAAQDKLDGLLKADTPNETDIATAREELVVAQAASTKADAELYAAGAGPIYMAGIAEWRAKAAVESAITAWNTAVGGVADASTALNASEVGIDNYVGLRDNTQIDALVDPDGNVILTAVRTYANVTGENAAVQDATTGDFDGNAGSGNFDAAGNLLIPKSDGDNNPATAVTPTESTFSYMSLNDRLTSVNGTVKALETLQTNNQNALLQPTIDEAVRRAKLEQAHYQAQFDAMIADTTDLTPDDDTQTVSVSSLYNAYRAAVTKRDNAGVTLETAVQTREMATAAVRDAFTSPQSFYQQLVDRRSYEKSQKDAEVTRLAGLTGDDAPSAEDTADAAKAVTDAQAALEEAEEIQASFQDLLADDSPVADLVLETLKADDVGDDGGVLVDTIDDAFDAAAEAMTTAENAETAATEAGNAVAALTAVDDPATEDDETGAVTKNTNDITTINDTLSGLTGDEGQVGQNIKDIERNTTDIKTNTDNIATNATDIATNATDIATNATDIATNATDIATNATDIATNVTAIATNATDIATNATDIATNVTAIATNATDIATNATDIATNATDIATNVTAIATNVTGIMANAGNIMTNATNIMTNEAAITTNASDIITNAGHIAMNNTYMMANRGMIEGNASDIMAVRGMAQTNAAGISTNAANIHRNSESIDMLRAGVAASMALAGMPEIGDRGVSVGAGSYDGESALAVGVHFSGENSRFKLGVTSADGETGVSLGAGWSF